MNIGTKYSELWLKNRKIQVCEIIVMISLFQTRAQANQATF